MSRSRVHANRYTLAVAAETFKRFRSEELLTSFTSSFSTIMSQSLRRIPARPSNWRRLMLSGRTALQMWPWWWSSVLSPVSTTQSSSKEDKEALPEVWPPDATCSKGIMHFLNNSWGTRKKRPGSAHTILARCAPAICASAAAVTGLLWPVAVLMLLCSDRTRFVPLFFECFNLAFSRYNKLDISRSDAFWTRRSNPKCFWTRDWNPSDLSNIRMSSWQRSRSRGCSCNKLTNDPNRKSNDIRDIDWFGEALVDLDILEWIPSTGLSTTLMVPNAVTQWVKSSSFIEVSDSPWDILTRYGWSGFSPGAFHLGSRNRRVIWCKDPGETPSKAFKQFWAAKHACAGLWWAKPHKQCGNWVQYPNFSLNSENKPAQTLPARSTRGWWSFCWIPSLVQIGSTESLNISSWWSNPSKLSPHANSGALHCLYGQSTDNPAINSFSWHGHPSDHLPTYSPTNPNLWTSRTLVQKSLSRITPFSFSILDFHSLSSSSSNPVDCRRFPENFWRSQNLVKVGFSGSNLDALRMQTLFGKRHQHLWHQQIVLKLMQCQAQKT